MLSGMADVTRLLDAATAGDSAAAAELLPLVYDELRGLAAARMAAETPDHTLQPTALVHEAYLRLVGGGQPRDWGGRGHFFAAAAEAMRRVLIDHARARRADKRGGGRERLALDTVVEWVERTHRIDLVGLDDALGRLKALDPRPARVVELRFFGGCEMGEIAEHLGVSLSTVEKDWRLARAWLHSQLKE
jgi:RNA polymerase sigma factor (TIGR02999 family)